MDTSALISPKTHRVVLIGNRTGASALKRRIIHDTFGEPNVEETEIFFDFDDSETKIVDNDERRPLQLKLQTKPPFDERTMFSLVAKFYSWWSNVS